MKGQGQRVLMGRVLSNRMDKTVVVEVERRQRHPLYGKVITMRKKYKAHDADNTCEIGDLIEMVEEERYEWEKTLDFLMQKEFDD